MTLASENVANQDAIKHRAWGTEVNGPCHVEDKAVQNLGRDRDQSVIIYL